MKRKYKNVKVEIDGLRFDSRKEARRYGELKLLVAGKVISDLVLQPKFELIPSQRNADGKAERACHYIGDFAYTEAGQRVVEDVKSAPTRKLPAYVIKRKLLLQKFNITIREI